MAKATKTIQQTLSYKPTHATWFRETHLLYNRVVAFYFEIVNAHEGLLELSNKEALTALETLTHATLDNPEPAFPLTYIADSIPAMFRRAAINAAMGSARSFFSSLKKWRNKKAKVEAKGKTCADRPPVAPRTWNKCVSFYAGMYKDRTDTSILLKVWTGASWAWVKVRTLGRDVENGFELGSPSLIRKGEYMVDAYPYREVLYGAIQNSNTDNKFHNGSVWNRPQHWRQYRSVYHSNCRRCDSCYQIYKGGNRLHGFRKRQLGVIARNRSRTGTIAEGEQDNKAQWTRIHNVDEAVSHRLSIRIVQFAKQYGARILVFEHLSNLKPTKGKYSKRGNEKRAYWMKGRIFSYAKYKAWNESTLTSRVNPRNTSRECARCHAPIIRYAQGMPEEGYIIGTPLMVCPECGKRDNADRNASLVIGQRLLKRYQEKPLTSVVRQQKETKVSGATLSQDAKNTKHPSRVAVQRHGERRGHGTAQRETGTMETVSRSIPTQLRLLHE